MSTAIDKAWERFKTNMAPLCVEPASSELAPPEPAGPAKVVDAVATGSLPAWSAHLFGLADKWETRARRYHLDADWLKSRDSRRSTEYRDSAIHWQCAANELRTEIVAANVRQPEENTKFRDGEDVRPPSP